MEINWDEVAQEADDTPRSILAEVLGIADDIESVVVLIEDKDGAQRSWWAASEKDVIAMLELAKFNFLRQVNERT